MKIAAEPVLASIHPLAGYLVNVHAPTLSTRKVIRAPFGGHCLTSEHKPPAMTLEEAEIARAWADERRGYRDGFAGRRANPEGTSTRGTETRTGSVALNLRIPSALGERLAAAAEARGVSQSAWVRAAIETKLGGG